MIKKKAILGVLLTSMIGMNSSIDNAMTTENIKLEKVKESGTTVEPVQSNAQLAQEQAKIEQERLEAKKYELLEFISSTYKSINMDIINCAFNSAKNRMPDASENEYNTMVALHLAVMEVETGFKPNTIGKNTSTFDYGIMQVNETAINHAKDYLDNPYLNEFILADNVEIGSAIIDQCYRQALEKHPGENTIWWMYAYYNRGLYFENYSWDFVQANARSNKFIQKYNSYYNILINN